MAEALGTFNPKDAGSHLQLRVGRVYRRANPRAKRLQGHPDCPAVIRKILSCHGIDAYVNVIGINSFCKTRLADHRNQLVTSGTLSPIEDDAVGILNIAAAKP
uniref:(northern house mosquito) hypothetical protein n=1 Tax=Culex pipiens TaxID=7175 RepID=A0A8D8G2I3_CULPI